MLSKHSSKHRLDLCSLSDSNTGGKVVVRGKRGAQIGEKSGKRKADTFTASLQDEADYFQVQSTIKCYRSYFAKGTQIKDLSHYSTLKAAFLNLSSENGT